MATNGSGAGIFLDGGALFAVSDMFSNDSATANGGGGALFAIARNRHERHFVDDWLAPWWGGVNFFAGALGDG